MAEKQTVTTKEKPKCPCCKGELVIVDGKCRFCDRVILRKVA